MKTHTLLFAVLAVILIVCAVIFILPKVTNAPTVGAPATGTSTATQNSQQNAQTSATPASLSDLVEVAEPLPGEKIASPLTISGKARGSWYFEATAPVTLKDASGTVIGHGTIRAQGEWMTTSYVPFAGTLTFTAPATHTGTLILTNDNPSGDPSKQKELDIPVEF